MQIFDRATIAHEADKIAKQSEWICAETVRVVADMYKKIDFIVHAVINESHRVSAYVVPRVYESLAVRKSGVVVWTTPPTSQNSKKTYAFVAQFWYTAVRQPKPVEVPWYER